MRAPRSSYDPADLIRKLQVIENYHFDSEGRLGEDESIRCFVCVFTSALCGTPVHAWTLSHEGLEPAVIELCEICNAAAKVAAAT